MVFSCARLAALVAFSLVTAGCIGAEIDEESGELIEEDQSAIESSNGYLLNALNMNALNMNALNMNALNMNALSPAALSTNALAAIKNPGSNGALSRDLMRYLVSCALLPNQTFSFSWTDSAGVVRQEVYRGELGIAHWWATGAIANDTYVQRQITACIAARTNWYGVNVTISLRNAESASMGSTAAERAAYTVREGAFWGNLFASQPYVRACYTPSGVARARELKRDCAAGHLSVDPVTGATTVQQCGPITIVGSCDVVCNRVDSNGGFYAGCLENPATSQWVRTDIVVTSFLTP
ncbi:hypothetical protein BE08_17125 [Sorangium cellulosum]|uniref:Secreted protein n=1 Tax=Sorangium cellulosum TaxID=56 RepID=A0A150P345_SORCE|nr:hypothetical protein BE08_17125 [Sorangium cellulosum]